MLEWWRNRKRWRLTSLGNFRPGGSGGLEDALQFVRLPFQQRRFSGDFLICLLSIALPPNLQKKFLMPSLSLMCIFLPAFWPSSAQSLACLGISRGAVAMLQEFLRRGKNKWAHKPDSNFREGSSAELRICSRPVWVSAGGKSSKRPPWKWWIFRWIFAVDISGRTIQKILLKKSARKSASRKHKIRRRTTPPKSTSQAPKSAAKPTNRSACQTSKYTPFFLIEPWRRLQSMDSGTLFGCLLGMVEAPMLEWTCNPSAAASGRDKVGCTPFQTTLSVKNVHFEKLPKNNTKSPRDSANSGSPSSL